jgi:hypothetical protein
LLLLGATHTSTVLLVDFQQHPAMPEGGVEFVCWQCCMLGTVSPLNNTYPMQIPGSCCRTVPSAALHHPHPSIPYQSCCARFCPKLTRRHRACNQQGCAVHQVSGSHGEGGLPGRAQQADPRAGRQRSSSSASSRRRAGSSRTRLVPRVATARAWCGPAEPLRGPGRGQGWGPWGRQAWWQRADGPGADGEVWPVCAVQGPGQAGDCHTPAGGCGEVLVGGWWRVCFGCVVLLTHL